MTTLPKDDLFINIIDNLEVGIHMIDKDGLTIYYNDACEKIDGISKKEIIGRSMYDLVNEGLFSNSVALKVIEMREEVTITQQVKERIIRAKGIPIYRQNEFLAVLVYTINADILSGVLDKYNQLIEENEILANELKDFNVDSKDATLISRSKKMMRIINLIDRVAKVDSTILLEGESGVGKTMFANYIHSKSPRKDQPFIKVDCSAIPKSLIESELFGYIEGSFTGAKKGGKKGMVEEAHTGTLFLDEVAELPLSSQVKLLTLLQEKTFQPVGSTERKNVDIRIISATNQNLVEMIEDGEFREDLYYRLKVVPIIIPPLRERPGDIVPLLQSTLNKINDFYDLDKSISPGGMDLLIRYEWPGNVRELENVVERLVVTAENERILENDVELALSSSHRENFSPMSLKEKVEYYEKSLIENAGHEVHSMKDLARYLNINESTLRKKIERFGIDMTF